MRRPFCATGSHERFFSGSMQVGYQAVFAKFAIFWALVLLLGLISETLGLLCSGLFRSQLLGAIVLQGLYVPLLMFVGFFQVCRALYS